MQIKLAAPEICREYVWGWHLGAMWFARPVMHGSETRIQVIFPTGHCLPGCLNRSYPTDRVHIDNSIDYVFVRPRVFCVGAWQIWHIAYKPFSPLQAIVAARELIEKLIEQDQAWRRRTGDAD